MKRRTLFLMGVICILLAVACEKKMETAKPGPHEVAKNLYTSENFIQFSKHFVPDLKSLTDYFHTPALKGKNAAFTAALREAGDNDAKTESVFTAYQLSMNEALLKRNKVDNDLLQLFNQEKILLNYNEMEAWAIIREAIDLGWASRSPAWQEVRAMSLQSSITVGVAGEGGNNQVNKLLIDEVWGCLREAVGLGSASVLGIAGLQKLASEGIQAAVVTLSKWLAQRAGWIGVIVMTLDFSTCLYKEAND